MRDAASPEPIKNECLGAQGLGFTMRASERPETLRLEVLQDLIASDPLSSMSRRLNLQTSSALQDGYYKCVPHACNPLRVCGFEANQKALWAVPQVGLRYSAVWVSGCTAGDFFPSKARLTARTWLENQYWCWACGVLLWTLTVGRKRLPFLQLMDLCLLKVDSAFCGNIPVHVIFYQLAWKPRPAKSDPRTAASHLTSAV